jgi:hypothetical protein
MAAGAGLDGGVRIRGEQARAVRAEVERGGERAEE